jgi:hypothetical protein
MGNTHDEMKKSSHKGAHGEALVIADLITYGITPHEPFIRDTPYDILAAFNGVYLTIQVKYRRTTTGYVEVSPRRIHKRNGRKRNTEYDLLAIVNERGHVAYIHTDEFKSSVRLRVIESHPHYRSQTRNFYNYKNPIKYFTNEHNNNGG